MLQKIILPFFFLKVWMIYFTLFFPKVWMITIIGTTFGIPYTVMGLTFIAAGVGLIIAIIIFIIIQPAR